MLIGKNVVAQDAECVARRNEEGREVGGGNLL